MFPYMVETNHRNNHVLRLYPKNNGVVIIDPNEPGMKGIVYLTWEEVSRLLDKVDDTSHAEDEVSQLMDMLEMISRWIEED